ncbi:hypothetical protein FA95DRAFT_224388 [Auriscalpium vulgare]|uniref:Uncharacterized protein n=1 Tax=Auriscalpium vulgare TaxID=40419 RepID=A0ACB8RLC5_9AGAM|nr:hypothetical protein FA95DRAFT_224388 [Auriscalpium vulgare]
MLSSYCVGGAFVTRSTSLHGQCFIYRSMDECSACARKPWEAAKQSGPKARRARKRNARLSLEQGNVIPSIRLSSSSLTLIRDKLWTRETLLDLFGGWHTRWRRFCFGVSRFRARLIREICVERASNPSAALSISCLLCRGHERSTLKYARGMGPSLHCRLQPHGPPACRVAARPYLAFCESGYSRPGARLRCNRRAHLAT